jgi:hypothetical protein
VNFTDVLVGDTSLQIFNRTFVFTKIAFLQMKRLPAGEIVGVILGSLPLIISAVEHYTDLVQTVSRAVRYKTELKSLKHDLDAESMIFLDTLERVLDGLISARQLEDLLNDPSSELWKDKRLNEKLEDRLGRSYSVYLETVVRMLDTIQQFNERLDIDEHGKVRWTESTGLKLALKRAGFSLRKRNFDDLVDQLQKHNRHLEKFTNRSIESAPSRQKRKVSRKFQLLGSYAKSAFNALESSFQCGCQGPGEHTALFGLTTPPPPPRMKLQSTIKQRKAEFHVVISGKFFDNDQAQDRTLTWQEVSLITDDSSDLPHEAMPQAVIAMSVTSTANKLSALSIGQKTSFSGNKLAQGSAPAPRKQVAFAHTPSTFIQSTQPSTHVADVQKHISSICKTISSPPNCNYPDSLGYILDQNCKFLFCPRERSSNTRNKLWSTVSLGHVIHNQDLGLVPQLTPWDRLSLAAKLASAVLQLHASPWLQSTWNTNDVLFLQRDNEHLYDQAFVANKILKSGKQAIKPSGLSMFNETLLALAVILVELCLGPIEKLQTADDLQAGVYANMMTLWRLANGNEIETMFGPTYQSAVKRCVELAKISHTLDENIEEDLYTGVVLVLEDQAMRKVIAI